MNSSLLVITQFIISFAFLFRTKATYVVIAIVLKEVTCAFAPIDAQGLPPFLAAEFCRMPHARCFGESMAIQDDELNSWLLRWLLRPLPASLRSGG